jgi:hypothetical protein
MKGRRFETLWGHWPFSIYLLLPASLRHWVYSDSNWYEYQKQKKKVFLGSRARPTREADNHTAICELSKQCRTNIPQPYGPPYPVMGIYLLWLRNWLCWIRGFESLVLIISNLDITPLKISRHFGKACYLHLYKSSACYLLILDFLLVYSSTLKIWATYSSEAMVNFQQTTRRFILEDWGPWEQTFNFGLLQTQWNVLSGTLLLASSDSNSGMATLCTRDKE